MATDGGRVKKLPRHYSGKASKEFWDRVGRVEEFDDRLVLYSFACALQDLENRMLDSLEALEEEMPRRKAAKP